MALEGILISFRAVSTPFTVCFVPWIEPCLQSLPLHCIGNQNVLFLHRDTWKLETRQLLKRWNEPVGFQTPSLRGVHIQSTSNQVWTCVRYHFLDMLVQIWGGIFCFCFLKSGAKSYYKKHCRSPSILLLQGIGSCCTERQGVFCFTGSLHQQLSAVVQLCSFPSPGSQSSVQHPKDKIQLQLCLKGTKSNHTNGKAKAKQAKAKTCSPPHTQLSSSRDAKGDMLSFHFQRNQRFQIGREDSKFLEAGKK